MDLDWQVVFGDAREISGAWSRPSCITALELRANQVAPGVISIPEGAAERRGQRAAPGLRKRSVAERSL